MDQPLQRTSVAESSDGESLPAINLKDPSLYINRELSWLEFNQRVLAQAQDTTHPLLERVKFLGITATNLDEFFMIRVATTMRRFRAGVEEVAPDGYTTGQQLEAMRSCAHVMLDAVASTWTTLRGLLEREQIRLLDPPSWTPEIHEYPERLLLARHLPGADAAGVRPRPPVPVHLEPEHELRGGGAPRRTHQVRAREGARRAAAVRGAAGERSDTGPHTFVFLEDVVRANIHELFPGTQVHGAHLFRIVRDADLAIEDEDADDLLESVDRSLRQLRRGPISLLQVEANMPARVLDILVENFGVSDDVVVRSTERLGFGDWHQLARIHRPDLKDPPFSTRSLWRADEDPEVIFDQIRYQDLLVHHPFESFTTVETFLRAAVNDRQVIAIKMTLYRIGADSPLIPLLIEAAEAGKQVAVLVELKARFDERNNIRWARRLESHGIHVVYGFAALKTHAKLCLVIRQELAGVQRYVHTSTGNYNPVTAKVYTDLGLFTADPEIVADVSDIFNYLTGYSNQREYRSLVVAPMQLRTRIRELIRRETEHARAGRPARIIAKMNAVTDDQMIRELYSASQAGVEIDLIVRGICSLRPGIPGVSEHIRVRSIVGRFLEHSRHVLVRERRARGALFEQRGPDGAQPRSAGRDHDADSRSRRCSRTSATWCSTPTCATPPPRSRSTRPGATIASRPARPTSSARSRRC